MVTTPRARALLDPVNTVLLVIDLQDKLLPAVARGQDVIARTRLMLQAAQTLEVPVVATTQYARGLGPTVPAIAEVLGDGEPVDKTCFGCFASEAFTRRLSERAPGRRRLVVAGVETHICVAQTVLGALAASFDVHVLTDGVGARRGSDHAVGLARMERAGAILSSVEMAIYELLGASDTEAFRALLPLLRERA